MNQRVGLAVLLSFCTPDLRNNRLALSGIVLRGSGGGIAPETVIATPPGRRFRAGSELYFTFFVYNASPNLVMQTRLFRENRSVNASPATAVDVSKAELGRVLTTGSLRLTPDLEPGNKQVPVTQWIDFEIVK